MKKFLFSLATAIAVVASAAFAETHPKEKKWYSGVDLVVYEFSKHCKLDEFNSYNSCQYKNDTDPLVLKSAFDYDRRFHLPLSFAHGEQRPLKEL